MPDNRETPLASQSKDGWHLSMNYQTFRPMMKTLDWVKMAGNLLTSDICLSIHQLVKFLDNQIQSSLNIIPYSGKIWQVQNLADLSENAFGSF